jgi:hypothetical protein
MRFCCRTGSTPRHPDTLSLFRYQYKDDTAVSRWPRHFHDEALSVSSLDQRNLERRRSYAFSTTIRSMDIRKSYPATISPKSNTILAVKRCRRRRRSTSSRSFAQAACPARSASANILNRMATLSLSPPTRTRPDQCLSASSLRAGGSATLAQQPLVCSIRSNTEAQ